VEIGRHILPDYQDDRRAFVILSSIGRTGHGFAFAWYRILHMVYRRNLQEIFQIEAQAKIARNSKLIIRLHEEAYFF
jgi:hypothetical protein